MADIEKVKTGIFEMLQRDTWKGIDKERNRFQPVLNDALALLKEQDAEIRQLRLALDIAKGTCKGIKSGGGQFADMPTMQSAT